MHSSAWPTAHRSALPRQRLSSGTIRPVDDPDNVPTVRPPPFPDSERTVEIVPDNVGQYRLESAGWVIELRNDFVGGVMRKNYPWATDPVTEETVPIDDALVIQACRDDVRSERLGTTASASESLASLAQTRAVIEPVTVSEPSDDPADSEPE